MGHIENNPSGARLNYENQVETLKWLRSLNAISQEEYHQKYEELRKLILPEKKVIGFEKTTSFSSGFKQEEKNI